jgi:hypothetical protein
MFFPTFGDTAMAMAPSILVVGLFGRAQNYDIDRLQIMSSVEVKRSMMKFCHATLAQWDSTFTLYLLDFMAFTLHLARYLHCTFAVTFLRFQRIVATLSPREQAHHQPLPQRMAESTTKKPSKPKCRLPTCFEDGVQRCSRCHEACYCKAHASSTL